MKIEELLDRKDETSKSIQAILNILLESPYFYKSDDERLFLILSHHKRSFEVFFEKFFGWSLVMDMKCAKLYKPIWYNEKITAPNRTMFSMTKRDECVAFLSLLEFFERESREQGVTIEDRENLRFRFGDWLTYVAQRFRTLFVGKEEIYTDEKVRQILREVMPELIRYRFLQKVKDSSEMSINEGDTIYECLPALWHYQATQLVEPILNEEDVEA